jgi:hypothetical protein
MNAYKKLYEPLIGFRIVGFRTEEDEDNPNNPWIIFEVQRGDEKLDLVVSQDPEGNGGGFVFIEDHKND